MRSQGAHAPNPHAPARHRAARHHPPSPTESSNHQGSLPRDPSRIAPYRPGQHPASRSTQPTASVTSDPANGQRQLAGERVPGATDSQSLDTALAIPRFCSAPSDHPRRLQPADLLATLPPCGSRHTFAWFSLRSQLARNIFPPNLTLGCRVSSFEPTHSYKPIGWRNIDPANGQRQLAGERVPGATDSQSPDTARVIPQFHSVPSGSPASTSTRGVCWPRLHHVGSRHTFAWRSIGFQEMNHEDSDAVHPRFARAVSGD